MLDWYAHRARDLPWRATRAPYPIWVSEIMLQQTQVATVLPRYAAWFDRFPTIEALAAASPDAVLKAWEGLGYYRRARYIHAAARRIMAGHGGIFPRTFEDILALPGIGRSTAGAIASFCFGLHTPVLDGNVKRVLKRWRAAADASDRQLWKWARQALDAADDAAAWNQAMMELGATVCTARAPACALCPVSKYCASAFQEPANTKRKAAIVRDLHWLVSLYLCPRRGIWLSQRPDSGIWGGLWTPPITEMEDAPEKAPDHIHRLTHRRLHLYGKPLQTEPSGDGRWVSDVTKLALPTGIHRLLVKYDWRRL